jgi:hypothetical protein
MESLRDAYWRRVVAAWRVFVTGRGDP